MGFVVLILPLVGVLVLLLSRVMPARSDAVTVPPTPTVVTPTVSETRVAKVARGRVPARAAVVPVRPVGHTTTGTLPTPTARGVAAWARVTYTPDAYGTQPLPSVITYTVQPGDTLSTIAAHFGLSLDAIRWSNPDIAYNPDDIYPGQVLRIPPVEGVVVEVQPGDTVQSLARTYNVPPEAITSYAANRLKPPYTLEPGTLLVIPGGTRRINVAPPRPYPGYTYMWPVRGRITQRFSARHRAWDIAAPYEAGLYAARSGRVRTVRWDDTGYGYMIIIDHGDGWNTLYAHLKGALVQPGQWVRQGDLIGRIGGTGRATGPHVHFEIRRGRVRYDPAQFLPPSP